MKTPWNVITEILAQLENDRQFKIEKNINGCWHVVYARYIPLEHLFIFTYRLIPKLIKYRRYMVKTVSPNSFCVCVVHQHVHDLQAIEASSAFVRWIDTEWQEEAV